MTVKEARQLGKKYGLEQITDVRKVRKGFIVAGVEMEQTKAYFVNFDGEVEESRCKRYGRQRTENV